MGPLLAMVCMAASGDNFRRVFWIAVAPAFIAVLIILYGVHEPQVPRTLEKRRFPLRRSELARLDGAYWWLTGVASVLTLARFSEAFLLLLAQRVGMATALIPGVLMTMSVVYAAAAYPFGRLSDGMSRRTLLMLGASFLVAADLILARMALR